MREKLCPHEQKMNSWAFLLHWGMQKAHVFTSLTQMWLLKIMVHMVSRVPMALVGTRYPVPLNKYTQVCKVWP